MWRERLEAALVGTLLSVAAGAVIAVVALAIVYGLYRL